MADPESKVFLYLAASELREQDLRRFMRYVVQQGPKSVIDTITELRKGSWMETKASETSGPKRGFDQERLEEYGPTIKRVEGLLIQEAGLTKMDAARALLHSLQQD